MNINRFINGIALSMVVLVGTATAQTFELSNTSQSFAAKRHVLAVKYNENKQTTVNMSGTAKAPRIMGKADVEFKQGRTNIRLEMDSFSNPQSLGSFYTTYLLWAVAPEGQTENLMELPIGNKFKIESTTKFQTFGLIITAEPHSRVELPGSMIVAENTLRKGTEGMISVSEIEYSGDPGMLHTLYSPNFPEPSADYNTPLIILGARLAVDIARLADAGRFAEAELRDAELKLATLEQAWPHPRKASDLRKNAKKNSGVAHDVMRISEHARKLSVERSNLEKLSAERQQASDSITQAQSEADRSRTEADRASQDAIRAQVETSRAKTAVSDLTFRVVNDAAIARERVAQAESETAKARINEAVARVDANSARLQTEEAKRERDLAQLRLYKSLSEILETRRESRGLIVNLSDVLFDTSQVTLKLDAKEKLSKLAGILSAYPSTFQIEVEGHTDSVGSNDSNLNLSRGRAESVRSYLVQSGVKSAGVISTSGFGELKPIAGNETAAGRQINRRVEIIIADQSDKQSKAGIQ